MTDRSARASGSGRALTPRQRQLIATVGRLGQISAGQIKELLYYDHASTTQANRDLRRLVEARYLMRIERQRLSGGAKGGSGQYVYALDSQGWFLLFGTVRFVPDRRVRFHSLAINDIYITLRELHRAGVIELVGISNEPDCWVPVAGVTLKPDLRADVVLRRQQRAMTLWIEVDMATQSQGVIRAKFEAYIRAWSSQEAEQWTEFPRILFVTVDEARANELRWLVSQLDEDERELFQVYTAATFPNFFI